MQQPRNYLLNILSLVVMPSIHEHPRLWPGGLVGAVGLVAGVLAANADAVAQYRAGKASTFGFLVGQAMKASRGQADPAAVNKLLGEKLSSA